MSDAIKKITVVCRKHGKTVVPKDGNQVCPKCEKLYNDAKGIFKCRTHGEYKLTLKQYCRGHICQKCYFEIQDRPFSSPQTIHALGAKNLFIVLNKGYIDSAACKWAARIKGQPVARISRWRDAIPANIVNAEDAKDKIFILQVYKGNSPLNVKAFGVKRKVSLAVSGVVTDDMLCAQVGESYPEIVKKYDCYSIPSNAAWQTVSQKNMHVGRNISDYMERGYLFVK